MDFIQIKYVYGKSRKREQWPSGRLYLHWADPSLNVWKHFWLKKKSSRCLRVKKSKFRVNIYDCHESTNRENEVMSRETKRLLCKTPLICSCRSNNRPSVVSVFVNSTVVLEACLVCDGPHWPPQRSPSGPFPVGHQLHVVYCSSLLSWCRSASPPSSSCRPGRSLPRRYDPLVFPELAGRRWRPLVRQISLTSPWKRWDNLTRETSGPSWFCKCVCVCVHWPQWRSVFLLCYSHDGLKGSILRALHLKTQQPTNRLLSQYQLQCHPDLVVKTVDETPDFKHIFQCQFQSRRGSQDRF